MPLFLLILISSCSPSKEEPVKLYSQSWIHGSENCEQNTDPPIQVLQYNYNTWILRQNKCNNYEGPFMYLLFGDKKAILFDTGATEDEETFPLYRTVKEILDSRSGENGAVELIVAHTHNHGDHRAADGQFIGKPNTTVLSLEPNDVAEYFNIKNWPMESAEFDLGNRLLIIIPIPGHQASAIAVYDNYTKILLTGDSFYPGRLYVNDWDAFKKSTERLVEFTDSHEISLILGNHIEMTKNPGEDYPIGTTYQPEEHVLPLSVDILIELSNVLKNLGDEPANQVHGSFIIFPVN